MFVKANNNDEDLFGDKIIGKTICEAVDEGSIEEVKLAYERGEGNDIQDPQNGDSALYHLFLSYNLKLYVKFINVFIYGCTKIIIVKKNLKFN